MNAVQCPILSGIALRFFSRLLRFITADVVDGSFLSVAGRCSQVLFAGELAASFLEISFLKA